MRYMTIQKRKQSYEKKRQRESGDMKKKLHWLY